MAVTRSKCDPITIRTFADVQQYRIVPFRLIQRRQTRVCEEAEMRELSVFAWNIITVEGGMN
jgi:hypothetical protein